MYCQECGYKNLTKSKRKVIVNKNPTPIKDPEKVLVINNIELDRPIILGMKIAIGMFILFPLFVIFVAFVIWVLSGVTLIAFLKGMAGIG